jgi:hypothetical protein
MLHDQFAYSLVFDRTMLRNLHVHGAPVHALAQQPHVLKMADREVPGCHMGVDSAGMLFLPRGTHIA